MVGKSCSKASLVFGLSGGTIRRWGGGTLAGQGGKCALQPPRKVATATISSVEFVLQVTLYLLLSGDGGIQRRSGGHQYQSDAFTSPPPPLSPLGSALCYPTHPRPARARARPTPR